MAIMMKNHKTWTYRLFHLFPVWACIDDYSNLVIQAMLMLNRQLQLPPLHFDMVGKMLAAKTMSLDKSMDCKVVKNLEKEGEKKSTPNKWESEDKYAAAFCFA